MKRTFIAVNINVTENLKNAYDDIYQKLRLEKINWVPVNNLHITLKFLGDTDEKSIDTLINKIDLILSQKKEFKIDLCKLGVFKSINEPRVLWIGCDNFHNLQQLSKDLNRELESLNFEQDNKPFKPHLTLGRIKLIKETSFLAQLIDYYNEIRFQTQIIDKIVLYESKITNGVLKYLPLHEFELIRN